MKSGSSVTSSDDCPCLTEEDKDKGQVEMFVLKTLKKILTMYLKIGFIHVLDCSFKVQ